MEVREMVDKCIVLHKIGPHHDRKLVSIHWSGWIERPTDTIHCMFSTVGRDFVMCNVRSTDERTSASSVDSPKDWGMVG